MAVGGQVADQTAAGRLGSGPWGGVLLGTCIGWAVVSATLLHMAPERGDAAWIVALAWAWGGTALAATWWTRRGLSWWTVLLLALLARLVFVGAPLHLSDDVYRYLWEGSLLNAGGNPFTHPPASLPGFDDALLARVNHPEVPSAYPPVALLWFRWLALVGGAPWIAQLWTLLVDVGVVALIFRLRTQRAQSTWPALLYALHPLPVLESAAGAHLDVLAVALGLAACAVPSRSWWGPLLAVLGGGAKILPATLLPTLSWRSRWRPALLGLTLGTLILGLAAWPILAAGPALLDGIGAYAEHWSFNGLLYPWLEPWLRTQTRLVLVLAAAAVALAAVIRFRDPVMVWWVIGTTFVLTSPTAHPWYALWMLVPALVLGRVGWAIAAVSCLGAYGVLSGYDAATGTWTEPAWLWGLTWGPALLAMAGDLVWRARASTTP